MYKMNYVPTATKIFQFEDATLGTNVVGRITKEGCYTCLLSFMDTVTHVNLAIPPIVSCFDVSNGLSCAILVHPYENKTFILSMYSDYEIRLQGNVALTLKSSALYNVYGQNNIRCTTIDG